MLVGAGLKDSVSCRCLNVEAHAWLSVDSSEIELLINRLHRLGVIEWPLEVKVLQEFACDRARTVVHIRSVVSSEIDRRGLELGVGSN